MPAASVVIGNLYIERISFFPDETDPPLAVDPNAVLTCPLFLKGFERVTTIDRQHPEVSRGIQHQKLAASRLLDRLKSDYGLIVEDSFGVRVLERAYRHYANDMTPHIKCPTSCSAQRKRRLPRSVRRPAQRSVAAVALSGGVFRNEFLLTRVVCKLERHGFQVLTHLRSPLNDGGISLGQAVVGCPRPPPLIDPCTIHTQGSQRSCCYLSPTLLNRPVGRPSMLRSFSLCW